MSDFDLWTEEATAAARRVDILTPAGPGAPEPAADEAAPPSAPEAAEPTVPPAPVAQLPRPVAVETAPVEEPESVDLPPLPVRPGEPIGMDELLRYSVEVKSSDLHVKADAAPTIRISGLLYRFDLTRPEPRSPGTRLRLMGDKERTEFEAKGEATSRCEEAWRETLWYFLNCRPEGRSVKRIGKSLIYSG